MEREPREIKEGDLTNIKTCISCEPTRQACPRGCQPLINQLYVACDGVELPDGWYFDPDKQITGKWNDRVKAELKIQVERCGCSAATRGASSSPLALLLVAALTCTMIGANLRSS